MTTTTNNLPANAPRTYGNWRKPKSAGLGGLGKLATGVMFAGIMASIVTSMFSGLGPAILVGHPAVIATRFRLTGEAWRRLNPPAA